MTCDKSLHFLRFTTTESDHNFKESLLNDLWFIPYRCRRRRLLSCLLLFSAEWDNPLQRIGMSWFVDHTTKSCFPFHDTIKHILLFVLSQNSSMMDTLPLSFYLWWKIAHVRNWLSKSALNWKTFFHNLLFVPFLENI